MYKSKRHLRVFATCSLRRFFLCNLLLFSPYFSPPFSLRSCIEVSSSLAVGTSRVSHKHSGQAHFSQVAPSAILREALQKKKTQKKPKNLWIGDRLTPPPCSCVRRLPVLFMFALCRREESMRLCTLASFCLSTQSALPAGKGEPVIFLCSQQASVLHQPI